MATAAKWPTSSGKLFLAALRKYGWRVQKVTQERTDVTLGSMTVSLPFTRDYILRRNTVGYWGDRFGLRPEEVRLK